ncbi:MAG: FAD-dependent monooxygenase [Celeribacter sp.]|jgi:salicylate hydroxylase
MSLIGQKVTVIGAGIAGLAVARALAMRGARVQVLEQAEAISEVGAGIQISPNGAAVIEALGLREPLARRALRADAVALRDHAGAPVITLPISGGGVQLLHRADLISVLADGAREVGVELRLLQRIERVDLDRDSPRLFTATGASADVPLLIGADGINSPLRAALNGTAEPQFSGMVAWRALVPCHPDDAPPPMPQVFMGPGRHLVAYPLRDGRLINLVGVEERRAPQDASWSQPGDPHEFRAAFHQFGGPVRRWLHDVDQVMLWGLHRQPVAENWAGPAHCPGAVLVGDAAHPTLPFLAQGANLALEDAWVLARCLSETDTSAQAMALYHSVRAPRVRRVVAAASANARNYHLSNPLVRGIAHTGLRGLDRLARDAMAARYAWIYDHDVTNGPLVPR